VGWGWLIPLVAVAGLIVALTATDALGPTHDIGLFIFEAAWVTRRGADQTRASPWGHRGHPTHSV
jgi:hypothetical protein